MEYKDIKEIIDDMGDSKLDELMIEFPDGTKVSLKKNQNNNIEGTIAKPQTAQKLPENIQVINEVAHIKHNKEEVVEENLKIIKSPMVGTFYTSSSPDKDSFVKVGDRVKKGDTLCIIEAMKLMNEIESEFDGEIAEVCICNESMVEYGMPLFKIR